MTGGTGERLIVDLRHPLTPGVPARSEIADIQEYSAAIPVRLIDELVVRRSLPQATTSVLETVV